MAGGDRAKSLKMLPAATHEHTGHPAWCKLHAPANQESSHEYAETVALMGAILSRPSFHQRCSSDSSLSALDSDVGSVPPRKPTSRPSLAPRSAGLSSAVPRSS